ncbi:MAG: glycosyltransferase family 2 protein [Pseudomonadota bacterium]
MADAEHSLAGQMGHRGFAPAHVGDPHRDSLPLIETIKNKIARPPWLMIGVYMIAVGAVMYIAGVILIVPRFVFGLEAMLRPVAENLVWYSGAPVFFGLALALSDILIFFERKRAPRVYRDDPIDKEMVTVVLTAYNDEDSIGDAVRDFSSHPKVSDVIVVSNNSTDRTFEIAESAGAMTFNEPTQGYGACVYRCFREALSRTENELIVLCEGDRTFRASDIDKLLAYSPHADIVNGTRIVEMLRARSTQLTAFMFYGNLFAAKLLEAKHLGKTTLTDLGSTYKLMRRDALEFLMAKLTPGVNLEFNAHFLDVAMSSGVSLIEAPVTFHKRAGVSKGGNTDNLRAMKVGLGMIRGLTFGWRPER